MSHDQVIVGDGEFQADERELVDENSFILWDSWWQLVGDQSYTVTKCQLCWHRGWQCAGSLWAGSGEWQHQFSLHHHLSLAVHSWTSCLSFLRPVKGPQYFIASKVIIRIW
jgi:hypothetical protein